MIDFQEKSIEFLFFCKIILLKIKKPASQEVGSNKALYPIGMLFIISVKNDRLSSII